MNIEGLITRNRKDKLRQLFETAVSKNVAIIVVVESHFRKQIHRGEVHIPGFRIYRMDRANSVKKGRVATYIREDLSSHFGQECGGSHDNTEYLCIHSEDLKTALCAVHRPGGFKGFDEAISKI